MNKFDIPCKCGHLKKEHIEETHIHHAQCEKCFDDSFDDSDDIFPWLHPFQSDNLSYIEKLAEQKGLV